MNIAEYKTKIKDIETRFQKAQKEYDRQQVLYEQLIEKLKEYDINSPEEIQDKLDEITKVLEEKKEKLDAYLNAFETKLQAIEELML